MENIIYEVIIGAVIIGVLFVIVTLFRSSNDVIRDSARKQNAMQTMDIEQSIGYSEMEYDSSKIKEAIEYARGESSVEVWVRSSEAATFVLKQSTARSVEATDTVKETYLQEGHNYLLNVAYYSEPQTANPSGVTGDRKSGDTDIEFVRFLFTRQ